MKTIVVKSGFHLLRGNLCLLSESIDSHLSCIFFRRQANEDIEELERYLVQTHEVY